MPALPLHEAGKYVAAAYIVFFGLVLVYVAIMAARLSRLQRDLGELLTLAQRRFQAARPAAGAAEHEPDEEPGHERATAAAARGAAGTPAGAGE